MRVITFDELPRFYAELAKQLPRAADRGLLSAAKRSATYLRTDSKERGIFNLGVYARSWKGERIPVGARVFNDATYAGVIEDGRRPNSTFPPPEPIRRWVRRRLRGALKAELKTRWSRRGSGGPTLDQIEKQVAFAVARKIARDGIPAKHVLREAMPMIRRFVREEVETELGFAIKQKFGGLP